MTMNWQIVRAGFARFSRWVQLGLSLLILCMGAMFLLAFVLMLPTSFRSLQVRDVVMVLGTCGLCWLQWHYRHWLYPRLGDDRQR